MRLSLSRHCLLERIHARSRAHGANTPVSRKNISLPWLYHCLRGSLDRQWKWYEIVWTHYALDDLQVLFVLSGVLMIC